jgi:hypothetical protein
MIDAKLKQVFSNLERSLPPGFANVDDVVRAIDARPAGELGPWLDQIAPVLQGAKSNVYEVRAALQAAVALSKEAGVPLAELKQRAVGRVEGAVQAHAGAGAGGVFVLANDAARQAERLDYIKRDFAAKARAAGQPLPNIGLDEQFKNAGEAKAYIGGLLAGDMLYWAKNAFEETARIEHAKSPGEIRNIVLGIDYAHYTGGGGPYHDYIVAKLDNTFSMTDIVDILGKMKHYGYPLSVDSQVTFLSKLLERRAGDKAAIEKMIRDVQSTERDSQSTTVARTFFSGAYKSNPVAAAALDAAGFQQHGLDMFGPIQGKTYPNRSALENLAKIAADRPEFKAFAQSVGARVEKAKLLEAIDAQIAKIKTPEELVAFALAFTGDRYGYQYPDGVYRSDRRINILWDVMKKHHTTAAELGVSFDWIANLAYAAYFHSIHMTDHGMLFEDVLKVLEPCMAHLKTPEQLNRMMASSDQLIQRTFLNERRYYPENYEKTWYQYRNVALSHLAENFETVEIGKAVVPICGTVNDAIKAKRRILQLAGDNLPDIQAAMALYFEKPSDAYLRDNEAFVIHNAGRVTGHRDFDLQALESLLAVQQFTPAGVNAIIGIAERSSAFAKWSEDDQRAAREKRVN